MVLRRSGRGRRTAVAAVLFISMYFAVAGETPVKASTPAYIDPTLFAATVPHQMVLGGGYQVQVSLLNNSTQTVEGAVQLTYPEQYFTSDEPVKPFVLSPGDNTLLFFNLIAANPHVGAMNVSALLFINGTKGFALESTVSTTVDSIQRSQLVNDIPYYALFGVLLVGGLYALALVLRRGRSPGPALRPSEAG
jgi:hypothetical protein